MRILLLVLALVLIGCSQKSPIIVSTFQNIPQCAGGYVITSTDGDNLQCINITGNVSINSGTTFNIGNFTALYDERLERFGNPNFTTRYDLRTDRFGNANATALNGNFLQNRTDISVANANITGEITKIDRRLRLGANYTTAPSNPNIGEADIMIIDNGITPTLRIRYNMNGVMKVADVALA